MVLKSSRSLFEVVTCFIRYFIIFVLIHRLIYFLRIKKQMQLFTNTMCISFGFLCKYCFKAFQYVLISVKVRERRMPGDTDFAEQFMQTYWRLYSLLASWTYGQCLRSTGHLSVCEKGYNC